MLQTKLWTGPQVIAMSSHGTVIIPTYNKYAHWSFHIWRRKTEWYSALIIQVFHGRPIHPPSHHPMIITWSTPPINPWSPSLWGTSYYLMYMLSVKLTALHYTTLQMSHGTNTPVWTDGYITYRHFHYGENHNKQISLETSRVIQVYSMFV